MKTYYQCRLTFHSAETTAWIEERAARVGATVELLPSHELWRVAEVFDHALPEGMLRDHQRLNRKSLPSIEPMS